MQSPFG